MLPSDFLFLFMGMLDNVAPEVTEPPDDKIARLTREAHARAVRRAGRRKLF